VSEGRVYLIGAGPGDPELVTHKASRVLRQADVILYADSLVSPEIAQFAKPGAEVQGTSGLHLEAIVAKMITAVRAGQTVARVHSGDPSIYGVIHEQIVRLREAGVPYEIIPGVSSVFAAAARLGVELTVPEVVQTVILTRFAGRTPMPEGERLRDLAAHQATLCLFLSISHIEPVVASLTAGGYPEHTPAAMTYRVGWPEERIVRGTLADIATKVRETGIKKHALMLVGRALEPELHVRSHLYDQTFSHSFRTAQVNERQGTAIVARTRPGVRVGLRVQQGLAESTLYVPADLVTEAGQGSVPYGGSVLPQLRRVFARHAALVCCLPLGIIVRALGSLVKDKHTDPAVVVVDEGGRFAVSVLAGHEGGAHALARRVAALTGGQAVITTAAEALDTLAVDLLGQEWGWTIANPDRVTAVSAAVINGERIGIYQDAGERAWGPQEQSRSSQFVLLSSLTDLQREEYHAGLVITTRHLEGIPETIRAKAVIYHPKVLVAGIGCVRGVTGEEVEEAVRQVCREHSLAFVSICTVATIDRKADEEGLQTFATRYRLALHTFSADQLNAVPDVPNPSSWARSAVGAQGVAEPAALLAAGATSLLVEKVRRGRVTVAIAEKQP
jgi:precorrin-4 C11-methyltransferase